MEFIDKMDMLKSIYEVDRKLKKWWHRLSWYFVDVSLVNAIIIFKRRSVAKLLTLNMFRLTVINGLIGADPDVPKRRRKKTNGTEVGKSLQVYVAVRSPI